MGGFKKLTGFTLFVREWQDRHNQRNFQVALKKAAPEWESLSDEEKTRYKEEAKTRNAGAKGRPLGIVPSPSPYVEKGSQERVSLKERILDSEMRDKLLRTIVAKPIENFINMDVYVISFNVSVRTKHNVYIPIEVGIVKYNLVDGIRGYHHEFIDGGRIPVGHGYEIKEHMERVHLMPLYDISEYPVFEGVATHTAEDHHKSVSKSIAAIEEFVQAERISVPDPNVDAETISFKPVFTLPDLDGLGLQQTDGCLKRMGLEVNNPDFYENYVVLDLAFFMFLIGRKVGGDIARPLASCIDLLHREVHSYVRGTNCMFHDSVDTPHCALARSYRFSYRMMDALVPLFIIEVKSEHLPKRSSPPKQVHCPLMIPPLQRQVDRATRNALAKDVYWKNL